MEKRKIFAENIELADGNFDLNEEVRNIYRRICEMDKGRQSVMIIPIKSYLEKIVDEKGNINPTRVEYLRKMVDRIYFGEYQELKELEKKENGGDDFTKRTIFQITFEGEAPHGINHLDFYRINEKTWRTSDIGEGWTVTCSYDPEWLVFDEPEEWEEMANTDLNTENIYKHDRVGKTKIFGMNVSILITDFKHANGKGCVYHFEFQTKEDADKFAEFLEEKRREQMSPDERLKFMRDDRYFFKWEQIPLIDEKYERIFGGGFTDELWNKYSDPYEYIKKKNQFGQALLVYKSMLAKKLFNLEAKNKFIDWSIVEKLLINHEGEVMELYKDIEREESELERKEMEPLFENIYKSAVDFLQNSKEKYDIQFLDALKSSIKDAFIKMKDHKLYNKSKALLELVEGINVEKIPQESLLSAVKVKADELMRIFKEKYTDRAA